MRIRIVWAGWIALAVARASGAVVAASNIDAVVVYPDRARVHRTAHLEIPAAGEVELQFGPISPVAEPDSVTLSGAATMGLELEDVQTRDVAPGPADAGRKKDLEDRRTGLQSIQRELRRKNQVAREELETLKQIEQSRFSDQAGGKSDSGFEQADRLITFLNDRRAGVLKSIDETEVRLSDLGSQIAQIEFAIQQMDAPGGTLRMVVARVKASGSGPADFALEYFVRGTSWTPVYTARGDTRSGAIRISMVGSVRQTSGEDWSKVHLTLSTARPAAGAGVAPLTPWVISLQPTRPEPLATFSTGVMADRYEAQSTLAGTRLRDMADALVVVQQAATNVTFAVPGLASVPSSPGPQQLPVASFDLQSSLEYHSIPVRAEAVFLTAHAANPNDFALLPGPVRLFMDGAFVVSTSLPLVAPADKFDLGLGVDDAITIRRRMLPAFADTKGIFDRRQRKRFRHSISVENRKRIPVTLAIEDQVPVSGDQKITVDVKAPSPAEAKPDENGMIKWKVELVPGQKRELLVDFSVESPVGSDVGPLSN